MSSGQPINLGGAFAFTTIGASTANGTLDLTGNFNGDPTRASHFRGTFSAAFNGTNDDLSLTIVFTSVTGFFTGIGNGSAAGTYDGRVFEAESPDGGVTPALTGSLTRTTTGTTCTFGGSLTAIGDPSYRLTFNVSATGGAFGGAQTPTLAATPISISAFAPLFEVASDDNFPTAASLKFTGPAGSGFSTPGIFATVATTDISAAHATYQPAAVRGPSAAAGPMGGAWSVLYKAVSRAFTVANPEAPARLVILKPSVTLSGPNIQQIDWVYLDPATGVTLTAPPPFVSQIQAVVQGPRRRHGLCLPGVRSDDDDLYGRSGVRSRLPEPGTLQHGDRDQHDLRGLADREPLHGRVLPAVAHQRSVALLLLGLLAAASPVWAAQRLAAPSIEQLARQADVVAIGEVSSAAGEWAAGRRSIQTRVTLTVAELLKGTAPSPLTFTHLGGRSGTRPARSAVAPSSSRESACWCS